MLHVIHVVKVHICARTGDAQLALLQGSPVLRDIDDRKRNMRSDYDEVVKACPAAHKWTPLF